MGQNKMEEDFRKKLGQRTIQPSDAAWDRLDAMLTVAEGRPKRNYKWLYAAAGILGFTLITVTFFGTTQELTDKAKDGIVHEEGPGKTELFLADTISKPLQTLPKEHVAAAPQPAAQKEAGESKSTSGRPGRPSVEEIAEMPAPQPQETSIAQNPNQQDNHKGKITPKTIQVDVDELLASVEKKGSPTTPPSGKSKVKVDAGSLLSQVDGELEMTFREKALHAVSRNYQTVKVALSNRNKE